MSEENVELVKTLQPAGVDLVKLFADDESVRAWAPEDLFATDFEVRFVSGVQGVEGEYQGLDGFVQGWRDWLAAWATYWVDVENFVDADEHVVALIRVRGKTSRDGVLMEHSPAALWTVEQGKIVSIRLYLERDEALGAAGLS